MKYKVYMLWHDPLEYKNVCCKLTLLERIVLFILHNCYIATQFVVTLHNVVIATIRTLLPMNTRSLA